MIKFKPIDITKAIEVAKKSKKTETKVKTKYKPKKESENTQVLISDRQLIEPAEGSIAKYINESHPDIRTFLEKAEIKGVSAKIDELVINTKNNLRVVIRTISHCKRFVSIQDKKKKFLFKGVTSFETIKPKKAEVKK